MKKIVITLAFALGLASAASAAPIAYVASLSNLGEAVGPSPGTGSARVIIDTAAHTLQVIVTFQDLIGNTTAAHVHCCTATPLAGNVGVATELPSFTGFPLGVRSGSYNNTFNTLMAATWNPTFLANNGATPMGAEAAFALGLASGRAYLNVHSSFAPGGEIRGFLQVPEPTSMALLGLGLAGMLARRRRAS